MLGERAGDDDGGAERVVLGERAGGDDDGAERVLRLQARVGGEGVWVEQQPSWSVAGGGG